MNTHVYIHTYVYIYTHTHRHVYIHTYIHTYIHRHSYVFCVYIGTGKHLKQTPFLDARSVTQGWPAKLGEESCRRINSAAVQEAPWMMRCPASGFAEVLEDGTINMCLVMDTVAIVWLWDLHSL